MSRCEPTRHAPRVYLASRFARRDEMRRIAAELDRDGFVVTSRWLSSPLPLAQSDLTDEGRAGDLALMDLEDLRTADICIAFTEGSDNLAAGRGGRHTELGIAVALGQRVVLVGPREHVFHCLPGIEQFPDWQAARPELRATAQRQDLALA